MVTRWKKIIYQKFISNGPVAGFAHANIYIISADGEDQRALFPDPEPGANVITMRQLPRWASSGKRFVFDDCIWTPEGRTCRLNIARVDGGRRTLQNIYKTLGNKAIIEHYSWMNNDRALLLAIMLPDKPNPNYDLYRYEIETGGIRQLTRNSKDEGMPHWTDGALSVSPQGKLPTLWGEKKQSFSQ